VVAIPEGIAWYCVALIPVLGFGLSLADIDFCRGVINTWGVYQTYYSIDILKNTSESTIAWVGSIQAFLLMFIGALSGPIYVSTSLVKGTTNIC
jgi:hypothetical protein